MNAIKKISNKIPKNGFWGLAVSNSSSLLLGSGDIGDLYSFDGEKLIVISQTGEPLPITNILSLSDDNCLITTGGKIIAIFGEKSLSEFSNTKSVGNDYIIADLGNDEHITDIIKIEDTDSVVISTTKGRILSCATSIASAYLTGKRTIYADVQDGLGNCSNSTSNVTYALYNKIAEVNQNKEIVRWKFEDSYSALINEKITGIFTGPIIHIKEDLGFWKELSWEEIKPDNTDIVISLRAANSAQELLLKKWEYLFASKIGETGVITRQLNNIAISGQYLQVKVEMITNKKDITPIVSKITLKYSTKQASYFFTTKFSLEGGSKTNMGLLTANITEPQNTEVKFGISNKDSNDWKDYTVINPESLFEIKDDLENIKVGIKLISYDEHVPEVAEFAIMTDSNKFKKIEV